MKRRRGAEVYALRRRNAPRMCAQKWDHLTHTSAKKVVRHWNKITQRSCGNPIPRSVPDQAGRSSEQLGLVEVTLPMVGELKLGDL